MQIGLKLDIGFADDETCRQLYGQRDILAFLRARDVEAIETAVGPETDMRALREHVARCVAAGFVMSFHPYSEGGIFNPASFSAAGTNPCRELHARFLETAAEAAGLQNSEAIVNVHAAAASLAAPRRELLEQSVAFLTWAREFCERQAPRVKVTTELQFRPHPYEPTQRICDNYDELLEVATRAEVRTCWDFGHAYWNAKRYDAPLWPPEELFERIAHVHCHDAHGTDHQPLIYGAITWKSFLRRLFDSGYDGRIILEVPPWSFVRAGGLQTLTDSLGALTEWIERCTSKDAV
jgi:sugar phosphate isomerase/epimerase